jgi:hypothetical protein
MRRRLGAVTAIAMLAVFVVGAEAAPLQPLVVGWEQFFTLDSQPGTRRGRPVVSGYVLNQWGMPAARIRLLVEGVGPGGEVMGQQLVWLTGQSLTPGARAYFEIPAAATASTYRVSVFAFEWIRPGA